MRPSSLFISDGPAETILDGQTGIFFEEQTPEALAQAVRRFEQIYQSFEFRCRIRLLCRKF